MFAEIVASDPDFTYRVLADSDSRVKNLMWTNGNSQMQYRRFGDVVTFDTSWNKSNSLFISSSLINDGIIGCI